MPLAPLQEGDPRRAGAYALRARLGSGGMGQVFLADGPRGERVAVKLLHSHVAGDREARARLARELRTLSRVTGPNVAEVVDADVDAARPFIVTQYVPGPTLEERVSRDGPLAPDDLLALARGLASALTAVHAVGVVHRDLKPGNVVCGPAGPTLLDFGIASAVDEAALTRSGEVWGTPAYLAPEQAVTGHAQPASDVHALGATLVFAATGSPPFGTGRADVVLYRVVHDTPAVPDLPELLRSLVAAMLERDPARRPAAAALLGVLTGSEPAVTSWQPTGEVRGTRLLTTSGATRTVTPAVPAPTAVAAGAPPTRALPVDTRALDVPSGPWSRPDRSPVAAPRPTAAGRAAAGPDEAAGAPDPWGPPEGRPAAGQPWVTAGPWWGRLVGVCAVLASAAGALVAPLAVPALAYAVLLPLHDAAGRTYAGALERRARRGPRPADGLRSGGAFLGHLLRAVLSAALHLPLRLLPGVVAASGGLLAALAAGGDADTAVRWSSAALTAALAWWLLSPGRQRHAAAARADLRRRAGVQGTAAGAAVLVLLTLVLLGNAGGDVVWFPLAEQPSLPGWLRSLQTLP